MKNILVIDESSVVKIELANELKSYELEIVSAKNEIEAINKIHEKKTFEVLLWAINTTDLMQFNRIKELNKKFSKKIPIMIVSKYADKRYLIKAIESGAKEFIVRPFDKNTLINKLSKFISMDKKENNIIKITDGANIINYSLMDIMNKEVKAASRGNYKLSLILIDLKKVSKDTQIVSNINNLIAIYIKLIKSKLRDTDIVIPFEDNYIIAVLPFCDTSGIDIVKHKINKIFINHTSMQKVNQGYKVEFFNVTYPDEGKTKDLILEALEKKLKNKYLKLQRS
jgi:PleD family two-component response regulator